jgi:hypothetical protein
MVLSLRSGKGRVEDPARVSMSKGIPTRKGGIERKQRHLQEMRAFTRDEGIHKRREHSQETSTTDMVHYDDVYLRW